MLVVERKKKASPTVIVRSQKIFRTMGIPSEAPMAGKARPGKKRSVRANRPRWI